jgi:hypothetical protein
MSSTNRKGKNPKRAMLDYYPTPSWVVYRFLEKIQLPGGCWFEPCAGDGAIAKAVNQVRSDVTWMLNEIQPEMATKLKELDPLVTNQDYLTFNKTNEKTPRVIITNPPFTLAMECLKKSFEINPEYVVFLLRLNFLASKSRAQFMSENTPDIYVLSQRPSFTANGGRDSIDYAWFVWHRDRISNSPGKLVILPNKENSL